MFFKGRKEHGLFTLKCVLGGFLISRVCQNLLLQKSGIKPLIVATLLIPLNMKTVYQVLTRTIRVADETKEGQREFHTWTLYFNWLLEGSIFLRNGRGYRKITFYILQWKGLSKASVLEMKEILLQRKLFASITKGDQNEARKSSALLENPS